MRLILMILLAIFLPPIAVVIEEGVGLQLLINLLLLLLIVGASIHAVYIVARNAA